MYYKFGRTIKRKDIKKFTIKKISERLLKKEKGCREKKELKKDLNS